MSSTPERLDQALDILRERGHEVATNPGAFRGTDGQTLVTVDGQLRTVQEIYNMAAFEEHKFDEGSSFVPDNPEGTPHIVGRRSRLSGLHDQHRPSQHAEHTRERSMETDRTSSNQGGGTTFDRDAPSDSRSEATAQKSISDSEFDKAYTSGRPPWDIGQPQPAFVALAGAGRITGKVLDVGCGTGENALFLCQRGLDVLGLDLSSVAIAEARTKAQARGVVARFVAGSALDLLSLEETFDTVIDSGLLHMFGGIAVFILFLGKIGFAEAIRQHMPIRWRSPNHIDPSCTFTAFLVSVLVGARRFAHASVLRGDRALHALLGMHRFPTDDTIRNLFRQFGMGHVQRLFEPLAEWQMRRLPRRPEGYTLDLDSTVFERYGQQEGSLKGHNPRKHGRPSHQSMGRRPRKASERMPVPSSSTLRIRPLSPLGDRPG